MGATHNLPFQYLERYAQINKYFDPKLSDELVELLEQRDRDLEDFLRGSGGVGEIIIDHGDVIYVGHSKAFRASKSITLNHVSVHLFALASADIIVDILKNGIAVLTLTLPATTQAVTWTGNIAYGDGDYFQSYVSNAGAGGAGLVVQGAFN
jgi:hypothetical protein